MMEKVQSFFLPTIQNFIVPIIQIIQLAKILASGSNDPLLEN